MTPAERDDQGRVVVLLERSPAGRATLEAAMELAARRHRELCGLFVEDVDLLRSARLPFAVEVRATSGRTRPLHSEQVERALRLHSQELRRWLDAGGRRWSLPWSLQVARGRLTAEVMAACRPEDLLVLGRPPARPGYRFGGGPAVERIAADVSCAVMIFTGRAPSSRDPVVAVADGEAGQRALAAAAALARDTGRPLVVLAAAGQPEPAGLDPRTRVRRLPGLDAPQLLAAMRLEHGRTLVLSRGSRALARPSGRELLAGLDEPVLLVP